LPTPTIFDDFQVLRAYKNKVTSLVTIAARIVDYSKKKEGATMQLQGLRSGKLNLYIENDLLRRIDPAPDVNSIVLITSVSVKTSEESKYVNCFLTRSSKVLGVETTFFDGLPESTLGFAQPLMDEQLKEIEKWDDNQLRKLIGQHCHMQAVFIRTESEQPHFKKLWFSDGNNAFIVRYMAKKSVHFPLPDLQHGEVYSIKPLLLDVFQDIVTAKVWYTTGAEISKPQTTAVHLDSNSDDDEFDSTDSKSDDLKSALDSMAKDVMEATTKNTSKASAVQESNKKRKKSHEKKHSKREVQ
jgi:hypothetical protein